MRKILLTSKIYIATMSLFIGGCVIHKRLQLDKMAGESLASYPAFFVRRIGVTKPPVQLGVGKNTLV